MEITLTLLGAIFCLMVALLLFVQVIIQPRARTTWGFLVVGYIFLLIAYYLAILPPLPLIVVAVVGILALFVTFLGPVTFGLGALTCNTSSNNGGGKCCPTVNPCCSNSNCCTCDQCCSDSDSDFCDECGGGGTNGSDSDLGDFASGHGD